MEERIGLESKSRLNNGNNLNNLKLKTCLKYNSCN